MFTRSPFTTLSSAIAALALVAATGITTAAPLNHPDIVRLGSNENPFGFSPKAREAMIAAIDSANYYNRDVVQELAELIAAKEGVPVDHILITAGSGVALELIGMAYAAPEANLVNISPGYPQVGWAFRRMGGSVKFAPLGENMGYDFDAVAKTIDANTRIVTICNPNNPTGALADPKKMRAFLTQLPESILAVVDEAYLELADTPLSANSMAPMVKLKKNVAVSRTFSKAYGMAGIRIGYLIAHPDVQAKLKKFNPGAAPSYIAAVAAKAALADQAYMEQNQRNYSAVRRYTMGQLDKLGLKYAYPQGAFVLFEIGIDSAEAQKKFRDAGIQVTRPTAFDLAPGDELKYKNWVRVSMGTQADMEKFVQTLKWILEKP